MSKHFRFLIPFLLFPILGLGQTKNYQGLLWEVSGNGLSTPSYLYGTMHVSNKLAFNVSDAFYNCLSEVDAICLESSPASWMQEYRDMGSLGRSPYSYGLDFYRDAFSIDIPGTKEVYTLLENKNSMMNQILYRYNPGAEDYQESTYLDMFIFQAGAKQNKPVHALEEMDEVIELTIKAMTPDKDKKRDNTGNSYLENNYQRKVRALEEAYRRGDLDQIDSLSKSNNPTEVYHKYFIVERNRNMVRRMDSLMRTQSVFTGIGAAHLPGEEGAIQLLRDLGYTVTAVDPKTTNKSHKLRKKFTTLYRPIEFNPIPLGDGFADVPVPGELFEMPTGKRGRLEYLIPEPVNGGYFSIIRLFTYGPLFNRGPDFYKATFDSLLYIATPGELMKKEEIVRNGHSGYSILTKTSKNALVNYNVFFTPTEVIIFKGSGNDRYIERSEPQAFFNQLKLKEMSSDWSNVKPKFGGASWEMKGLVTGQDMIRKMDETEVNPCYQSYDQSTESYFMVMRYNYDDLEYIEEDSFDLAFLGKTFAEEIGYEVDVSTEVDVGHRLSIEQYLKPDEDHTTWTSKPRTKIVANGATYFVMVAIANEENTRKFFDSFKFTDFEYDDEFTEDIDSTLSYRVQTIVPDDKPDYNEAAMALYRNNLQDDEEDLSYLSETDQKTQSFVKTGESILIDYVKFHDYDEALSVEDFWDYRVENLMDDNYFIVSRETFDSLANGDRLYTLMLSDTGSARGIWTKFHLHEGVLYTLQSLVDTVDGPSKYVSTFFDSFSPLDTVIGRSVFENKAQLFFDHALGTDSLNRVNAIKSIEQIDFEEEEVPSIINTYRNFEYSEDNETEERENLIMAMGDLKSDSAYAFLYKEFDKNTFDSDIQFIIMKCFSYTESQEAYDAIKKLLLDDTPVTDNFRKMRFFDNLYDSLELADNYFPDLLELALTYPEYKPYLIEILAWGYQEGIYEEKHFKGRADFLKRQSLIELKRTVADQEKDDKEEEYYYGTQYDPYQKDLLDYYAIMCGLRKAGVSGTDKFFEGLSRITDKRYLIEQEIINHKLDLKVDTAIIREVSEKIKYRVWVYNRLEDNEMLEYYPDYSQQYVCEGILYNKDYDPEEDTIAFIERRFVNNGVDTGYVYFFKRKKENDLNWTVDYVGLQPSDESAYHTYGLTKKLGLAFRNEEEMEETIEKSMEVFEYMYRKRVNVSSGYDWGSWGSLFGGY